MPRDDDFHELATRFPEAALNVLGFPARPGEYQARAVELKGSKQRLDDVFFPREGGRPVLAEVQRRHDVLVARSFCKKVVDFARQEQVCDLDAVVVTRAPSSPATCCPPTSRGARRSRRGGSS